jgi:hypothetical protein
MVRFCGRYLISRMPAPLPHGTVGIAAQMKSPAGVWQGLLILTCTEYHYYYCPGARRGVIPHAPPSTRNTNSNARIKILLETDKGLANISNAA